MTTVNITTANPQNIMAVYKSKSIEIKTVKIAYQHKLQKTLNSKIAYLIQEGHYQCLNLRRIC